MAMKSLEKINTELQFLCRQNELLSPKLHRVLLTIELDRIESIQN